MGLEPVRVSELLVGLGGVEVLGVEEQPGGRLWVGVRCAASRAGVRELRGRCVVRRR